MGLGTVDVVLLILSLLASAGIGIYHGIKGINQTSSDYLLGSRRMKPLPLAMSLTVGTVSAITIMGNAGEMYAHGTQLCLMDLGLALGMFFVAKYFIPIFYPLSMISIYQYIESRFKSIWLRRATVVLTLGGSYVFIGFLLYPPAEILKIFTGFSITPNIVITGLVCSVYSSFGGVKAVVYADVLQSIIMIAGSLAIVIQGSISVGGFDRVWDIAYHRGRVEFFNFDLDPFQRHSFWLVIVYGFFFSLSTYGVNQSQTQRAFSTSSVNEAQRVIYYATVGMLIFKTIINLTGIVIFANFADCDPLTLNPNYVQNDIIIMIHYVKDHLTSIPGLAGLFIASIYAAVLSSVSTQVNSMTALLWEDFLKGLPIFKGWNEIKVTRLQKVLVLATGIIGIFASLIISRFKSFLEVLLKITGAVWGPMVGLFLVSLYLPWVKIRGASLGFVVAIIVSLWVVIGQITTQPEANFLPMSHSGCAVEDLTKYNISLPENNSSINDIEINKPYHYTKINRGIGFYGISYCLNYCWGVVVCVLVSVIFTALTSYNDVDDVEEKLINPKAWKLFSKGLKAIIVDGFKVALRPKQTVKEVEKGGAKEEEELEPMETKGT